MMEGSVFQRGAGILLPIFSLPGKYGIGDLGDSAYQFIDFLSKAGQKYWQVLPIGPTGYGDSPYASHSAFAGNPYFIPPEGSVAEKHASAALQLAEGDVSRIDYARLYRFRNELLHHQLEEFPPPNEEVAQFEEREREWLWDYAVYQTAKKEEEGRPWFAWRNTALRDHDPQELEKFASEHKAAVAAIVKEQYLFDRAWQRLHTYAAMRGVSLIGDIPLYVAWDSSDVWANRELFLLDRDGFPSVMAGVPPDEFSVTGQLWGNPIYNWENMREDGFSWWRMRTSRCAALFDALRIDHFIGLAHYYAVPRGAIDARNGTWHQGPGRDLLSVLCGACKGIIAEDLGCVTDEVLRLQREFGIPGMKILQFAFDGNWENDYLPHRYPRNCVVYGGTHDNETLVGYFSAGGDSLPFAAGYLGCEESPRAVAEGCLRAGLSSVADIAVFTVADWLMMDNRARINTPAISSGNWQWRVTKEELSDTLAEKIRRKTQLYER